MVCHERLWYSREDSPLCKPSGCQKTIRIGLRLSLESLDHSCWIADGHEVGRQLTNDHRSDADYGVRSYPHPWTNDHAATEPDIVHDHDRLSGLPLVPAQAWIDRMGDGQQLNVGPYLNIVPIVTAATSNETRPQFGKQRAPMEVW